MTRRYALLGALLALAVLVPVRPAAAQFTPTALATLSGADRYGQAVVPIGDLDGNGVGDYAIGRPFATVGGETEAGSVRLQFMTTPTTAGATVDLNPGGLLTADTFGAALAVLSPAPALQLLVGSPGFYGAGNTIEASGRVYVLSISSAGAITGTDTIDDTDLPLAEGDNFGASLAVLSQGATSTFLVGAPQSNCTAGLDCGSVVAISYTGTTATVASRIGGAGGPNITQSVLGIAAGDQFGRGLASSGGSTAFVGAPFADAGGANRGRVYAGAVSGGGVLTASAVLDGANLTGLADGAQFGYAIAARAVSPVQVAVGAPGTNGSAGAVWALAYQSGTFTDADASTNTPAAGSLYGAGVALPGNQPGYTGVDLAVGAPGIGTVALTEASGAALPVEVTAFEAVADGARLVLRWTTASETGNAAFYAEAQRPGAAAWQAVGHVAGAGTTSEAHAYELPLSPTLAPGRYTLRLVQQDLDGARTVAATTEAVVGIDGPAVLSASPNPARSGLSVRAAVREAQVVRVTVVDVTGREVARLFEGPMQAGEGQTWRVDAGALPAGTYLVRLVGERGVSRTAPVVVLR